MNKHVEAMIARLVYIGGKLFRLDRGKGTENRILVVRPDAIGDMVLTIPFLRELRRNRPKSHIALVCNPGVYDLVELCPYVDEFLFFDKRARRHKFFVNLARSIRFAWEHGRKGRYGIAISPSYANPDTYADAWICFLSGIPRRISYSEELDPEKHAYYMGNHDIYFTELDRGREIRHEAEAPLGLLRHMGMSVEKDAPELWTEAADEEAARALLEEGSSLEGGRSPVRILVCLSSSNKTKDWPVEHFAETCRRILRVCDAEIILIGADRESREYGEAFCRELPMARNLIGKTTLRQTAAVMRMSDMYLGGDTGPMHMAAACGLCGAAVYKTAKDLPFLVNNPAKWFAPWKADIAVCQPEKALPGCEMGCGKEQHCIRLVTVEEVYQVMLEKIRERGWLLQPEGKDRI